jgi:hypothetical protein
VARYDVMAVASFGGHFEQLLELRDAWKGRSCLYVTTRADVVAGLEGETGAVVQDCHAGQHAKAALCLAQLTGLAIRHRPRNVVTTGALPGLLALMVGRCIGARAIWVDSLANAETLSLSGQHARRFAHHHFSQWPDVAARDGSSYAGSLF